MKRFRLILAGWKTCDTADWKVCATSGGHTRIGEAYDEDHPESDAQTTSGVALQPKGTLGSTKFTIKFTTKIRPESGCADNLRCCATTKENNRLDEVKDKVSDEVSE